MWEDGALTGTLCPTLEIGGGRDTNIGKLPRPLKIPIVMTLTTLPGRRWLQINCHVAEIWSRLLPDRSNSLVLALYPPSSTTSPCGSAVDNSSARDPLSLTRLITLRIRIKMPLISGNPEIKLSPVRSPETLGLWTGLLLFQIYQKVRGRNAGHRPVRNNCGRRLSENPALNFPGVVQPSILAHASRYSSSIIL
jgi:hypothetical protein